MILSSLGLSPKTTAVDKCKGFKEGFGSFIPLFNRVLKRGVQREPPQKEGAPSEGGCPLMAGVSGRHSYRMTLAESETRFCRCPPDIVGLVERIFPHLPNGRGPERAISILTNEYSEGCGAQLACRGTVAGHVVPIDK